MSLRIAGSVDEALAAMAEGARPVAGGSDLVVGARQGKQALPDDLVAIDRIEELSGIEETENGLAIGAGVTHAQLMTNARILELYPSLADAAALVGSPATRNVGTLGGNVMNGSPAMDTGAPLMVLGAGAVLQSLQGTRTLSMEELWTGPGTTSATAEELCTALVIPAPADGSSNAYVRLEYRRAMEIAVVGAAAAVTLSGGEVSDVQVALTAVAPTILGLSNTESVAGQNVASAAATVQALAAEQANPISDVRAGAEYRRQMVGVMAKRAVLAAAARAQGEAVASPVNRSWGVGA